MKIAVEGCAHGDLEKIYDAIGYLEQNGNFKVDLLLCCGDFQATRNANDLRCMAVPPKYQQMCSFYKYYSGEKKAPILTIFIGGNHEASNHLQELPFGGWVAPNIYYLGYGGVVNVGGVRIGGVSGIYKGHDYMMGHHERPPYSEESKRSVYHVRNIEVFRIKQIKTPIDIFMSHDWPRGINKFGNTEKLLKVKPFFRDDIENNKLGSPACEELLFALKPKYWFSAHLHCKFPAIVTHQNGETLKTKFLALDKCLPRRKFLQILDIEHDSTKAIELEYDLEWLTILHFTNHLMSVKKEMVILPNSDFTDTRWDFTPTEIEKEFICKKMSDNLKIPLNFVQTVSPHVPGQPPPPLPRPQTNPQTQAFSKKLGVSDLFEEILSVDPPPARLSYDPWTPPSSEPQLMSTPEKNSFIESEEANDDSETSSSEVSTPVSLKTGWDDEGTSPSPRQGLSLPPPKNPLPDEEHSLSPSNNKLNQFVASSPIISEVQNPQELFFIDTNVDSISTTPSATPVGPKKFKRRNQNIYNNDDDDDS